MLMICETKIDNSFPNGQFQIKIFNTPFRLDRDKNGFGLIIFSREDISAKLLYMDIISCVLNGWYLIPTIHTETELLLIHSLSVKT